MKDRTTTILLALFLGGLGVHRFYLGQNTLGVVYLLFCWTFIPAIASFFDCLVFALMNEETFDRKYNPGVEYVYVEEHVGADDRIDSLERLADLYAEGMITRNEYEIEKARIIK